MALAYLRFGLTIAFTTGVVMGAPRVLVTFVGVVAANIVAVGYALNAVTG